MNTKYDCLLSLAAAIGIIDARLVPVLIEKLKTEIDEIKVSVPFADLT